MQIKYEFVDGEKTQVEVDDTIGTVILEARRLEKNQAERERYHCYSLDGAVYEGEAYADTETPESIFFGNIESEHINRVLNTLSETQRRRLILFAEGMSINEIARLEGVQPNAVWKSVEGAKKKFIKNFLGMGV